MAKYFTIMNGLRGCYMPDSCSTVKVDTRRELKRALESEAFYLRDGNNGLSKRAIATLAADIWRESNKKRPSIFPYVAGYGRGQDRSFGIHCSVATRQEYLDNQEMIQ